ncbi:MAG: ABC transporter substrate-binding protein, partial [Rhodospirillales bacterium]
MKRRDLLKASVAAGAAAGGLLAAPAIARAKDTFNWKMTNMYPAGAPFYTVGPGSPTDFCARVKEMSDGRLN